jgi:hypothetical protein
MLPAFDRSRYLGPVVPAAVVELQEVHLFLGGPLVVLDGTVEVVVVSFPALFPTPVHDAILLFEESRYVCPFLDPPDFVKFFEGVVLLHEVESTATVQAFLSVMTQSNNLLSNLTFSNYNIISPHFDYLDKSKSKTD